MKRPDRVQVVAAAGVVAALVAAGVILVLVPGPTDRTTAPSVTVVAADPTSICAPLTDSAVAALRRSDLAVEGRVESVRGDVAEVAPIRVLRGPAVGLLRIRTDAGGGPALDGPVLRKGDRVLVAAVDGEAQGCGLSAVASPALLQYYSAAFIS